MGNWNRHTHYLCRAGCGPKGSNRRIPHDEATVTKNGVALCPFCRNRLAYIPTSKTRSEVDSYERIG
jgi:hypothetical protein